MTESARMWVLVSHVDFNVADFLLSLDALSVVI